MLRVPMMLALALMAACGGAASTVKPEPASHAPSADVDVPAAEPTTAEPMTRDRLESVVTRLSPITDGGGGVLAAVWNEVPMLVVSDESMDRMRIVSPIVETTELTERELEIMMEANYHATLDARYATSEGVLYAAYIHPLSSLTEEQVLSAMRQVAALVRNFGTTWSSDEMIFGSRGAVPEASPVF